MSLLELNKLLKEYDGLVGFTSVLAAIATVFATFIAVLASLKIAKDGIRAKLKARLDVLPSTAQIMYPSHITNVPKIPGAIGMVASNVGLSDIYIRRSGLRWRLPSPFRFSLSVYVRDSSSLKDPTCIRPGSAFECILLENVDWEINRIISEHDFKKSRWFQRFLFLELTTDNQQKFRVSLPNELKDVILWAVKGESLQKGKADRQSLSQ